MEDNYNNLRDNNEEAADGGRDIAGAVERITRMEMAFDKAKELMAEKDPQLKKESQPQKKALITALDAYYTSHVWKRDFALDEEGLLPDDLKRGVLSEDGIYNLLEEQKESSKLCVIFPGLGYHSDKPLLYYSKKLALQSGYEITEVQYKMNWSIPEIKNDEKKMAQAIDLFTEQALEQLTNTDFEQYSKVLFVGKSIGTAIAARVDKQLGIGADHLVFTPAPMTFDYLDGDRSVVFHGLSDPWCDNKVVEKAKDKLGFDCFLYPDANHSLECPDVNRSIELVSEVMNIVEEVLAIRF